MKVLKILNQRVFKKGFILQREIIETEMSDPPRMEWTMAYTPNGDYIGDAKTAYRLCVNRGIKPEKRKPEHRVCSVGFSTKNGKWYGWSHRAICGFKIGSTCRKGDAHYVPRRHHGRGAWTAKTVADARKMACDFAEGVS